MTKVNEYGMQTGIIKIIPPKEWVDAQPPLDDIIKTVKAPHPIKQEIMAEPGGGHRVLNMQAHKIYNLPQWYKLCQMPEHQPPARRGERRAAPPRSSGRLKKEKKEDTPAAEASPAPAVPGKKKRGRPSKKQKLENGGAVERLPTPSSPPGEDAGNSVKAEPVEEEISAPSAPSRRGGGRMGGGGSRGGRMGGSSATTVSARRKNAVREGPGKINEADFVDFEYKMDISEYTKERCEELEKSYWKGLTYAPPLYGADMLGSLFDDRTTAWNLGKLPNLLDVMGEQIPGVNTAYLYLGMWKATFAWHLEDVDLYSINYLHFGAPKQWYSISQKDARKFEAAMANIWPQDAKACDQFLRHKTFIISPTTLLNKYGVKVNRTTHYPGEFVVTYPYGYHSGFNMGYNCAEAVNFALPSWLEMGRIAKRCECEQAQDSVWINVRDIERKLNGEETESDESEEDENGEEDDGPVDLPTPPESSGDTKLKQPRKKKKKVGRKPADVAGKKIKIRLKTSNEPCCLCPNDIRGLQLLPTDDGCKAHRICGEYTPETEVENNKVWGVRAIDKARLDLKCIYCRNRKGAKIQCSQKKCARAYHATCAAAAGMFVEHAEVPVFGEDGTEYKTMGCSFSCRFHRAKRDKKIDVEMLEADTKIHAAAISLNKDEIAQFQFLGKDIFAGLVLENRYGEGTLLVEVLPSRYVRLHAADGCNLTFSSERVEVEYKYLLLPQDGDFHLDKPSDKAVPLPRSRNARKALQTSDRHADDLPRKDDIFVGDLVWAEFANLQKMARNAEQVKVDLTKSKQLLYYLGEISKESTAYFTADPNSKVNDPSVSFLNTVPKPLPPPVRNYAPPLPRSYNQQQYTPNRDAPRPPPILPPGYSRPAAGAKAEKPYEYKPRKSSYTPSHMNQPQQSSQYRSPQNHQYSDPSRQQYGSYGQSYHSSQSPSNHNLMGNYYSGAFKPGTGPLGAPAKLTPESYLPFALSTPILSNQTPNYHTPVPTPPRPTSSHHQQYNNLRRYSSSISPEVMALMNKYPYLLKEHNRSASTYKSPYRQDGIGFCNGYEGDFKKHMANLMKKDPSALLKASVNSARRGSAQYSPPVTSALPLSSVSSGGEYGGKSFLYGHTSPSSSSAVTNAGYTSLSAHHNAQSQYSSPSSGSSSTQYTANAQYNSSAHHNLNTQSHYGSPSLQASANRSYAPILPPILPPVKKQPLHPAIRATYSQGFGVQMGSPANQANVANMPNQVPPVRSFYRDAFEPGLEVGGQRVRPGSAGGNVSRMTGQQQQPQHPQY